MDRLGFVQADPIRAPARAQDLILRQRVPGYRAGDLDRGFARLGLEEDFLYAYGFVPPETRALLHPRPDPAGADGVHVPDALAAAVLDFVRARGPTHPAALEAAFGRERTVNAWGGFSKATTRVLEALSHYGLLRVAGRRDGIRLFAAVGSEPGSGTARPAAERAREVVLLVTRILGPISPPSLRGVLALAERRNGGLGPLAPVVAALLREGALRRDAVEGENYLSLEGAAAGELGRREVRLLAPFDPLVWDRRRFEHLWGWSYRFEAYTPPGRRQFGYYALPMLWGDAVIGWANVLVRDGRLDLRTGFAGRVPTGIAFRRGLDAEAARFERFLGVAGD